MKTFYITLIASFLASSTCSAQDVLTLVPWSCTGSVNDPVHALPLQPNNVETRLNVVLGDANPRSLWMNVFDGLNSYDTTMMIQGGQIALPIRLSPGTAPRYVYFELLAGTVTTASADIAYIPFVQSSPTLSFQSYVQIGSNFTVSVRSSNYQVLNICPDYETYVMQELTDMADNSLVSRDSALQAHQNLEDDYFFETTYAGEATLLCLKSWLRVRNSEDNSYVDVNGSEIDTCGIVVTGLSLSTSPLDNEKHQVWRDGETIIWKSNNNGFYQLISIDGKVCQEGTVSSGENRIRANFGSYVFVARRSDGTMMTRTLLPY